MYGVLNTKAKREAAREAQFNSLINNGYKKTEYKNLVVVSNEKDLLLKSFWGTAANHSDFYRYRNLEQLNAKIESLKETADRREKWKKDQKEKNAGHQSSHASTAAAIRQELKTKFPNIKFSVTSESFAGGNAARISWENGATVAAVEEITQKYQYGRFNGMEDIYENSNDRDDIPQVKYVTESRSITDDLVNEVKTQLMQVRQYSEEQLNDYRNNPETEAIEILYKTNIPTDYKKIEVRRTKQNCGCIVDLYELYFETEQKPIEQHKEAPATNGKIQIIDYSEKSFAVIGETKPIKDDLRKLGGSFNARLNCGAGWIFSKTKLEAVKSFLIKNKEEAQAEEKEAEETQEEPQKTTLKDEIKETVNFFVQTDLALYGEIAQQTKDIAEVQAVEIPQIKHENYNNLEDINQAAKSGKVISLLNLSNLINSR